jgi:hypothetical protein
MAAPMARPAAPPQRPSPSTLCPSSCCSLPWRLSSLARSCSSQRAVIFPKLPVLRPRSSRSSHGAQPLLQLALCSSGTAASSARLLPLCFSLNRARPPVSPCARSSSVPSSFLSCASLFFPLPTRAAPLLLPRAQLAQSARRASSSRLPAYSSARLSLWSLMSRSPKSPPLSFLSRSSVVCVKFSTRPTARRTPAPNPFLARRDARRPACFAHPRRLLASAPTRQPLLPCRRTPNAVDLAWPYISRLVDHSCCRALVPDAHHVVFGSRRLDLADWSLWPAVNFASQLACCCGAAIPRHSCRCIVAWSGVVATSSLSSKLPAWMLRSLVTRLSISRA